MATEWEVNVDSYHPETRRKYGDAAADRANVFRREGLMSIGSVSADGVADIRAALDKVPCSSVVGDVCHHYDLNGVLAIAALKEIALMPAITRVAAMHIGAEPKILDVSCWKTMPGDGGRAAAQRWHRDVDDWRACKLFVYLTTVGPDNGPFMYVPGSHRYDYFEARGLAADGYFCPNGDDSRADAFTRLEICGPMPGKMFMVNTFGYHRGKPVAAGERVLFQVLYGLMGIEHFTYGTKIPRIREAWGM